MYVRRITSNLAEQNPLRRLCWMLEMTPEVPNKFICILSVIEGVSPDEPYHPPSSIPLGDGDTDSGRDLSGRLNEIDAPYP